jgi:hypothetical protein
MDGTTRAANKSPSAQAAARAIIKFATLEQATGRRSAQIRARIARGRRNLAPEQRVAAGGHIAETERRIGDLPEL